MEVAALPGRSPATVALVWRRTRGLSDVAGTSCATMRRLVDAMRSCNLATIDLPYGESDADWFRRRLSDVQAVLVWVNPLQDGLSRVDLDSLLREASDSGTWVSAHPATAAAMGTKEVLFRTRALSWDADTHMYRTSQQLRLELPARLAGGAARVLKQNRGNNGIGVWKVEAVATGPVRSESVIRVLRAHLATHGPEHMIFADLADLLEPCFALGPVIDQHFQERLPEGMVRAYFVADELVGFCHQKPRGLLPVLVGASVSAPTTPTFTMEHPSAPAFTGLRAQIQGQWLPGLLSILRLDRSDLPALWDADFLFATAPSGHGDRYVLCEINVNAVWPFPDRACDRIARLVRRRLVELEKNEIKLDRGASYDRGI